MTITSEERELLDMLHKAMPERKNLMLITLTAGAHLDGITEFELPQCSRAEYKRHIKALRQMQHTDPTPYIRQVATKGIELIREVCPIQQPQNQERSARGAFPIYGTAKMVIIWA